jgi:hypothetical protein
MLHNPYCSPSTSRVTKTSGVNYIPPGLVNQNRDDKKNFKAVFEKINKFTRHPYFFRMRNYSIFFSILPRLFL